MHSRQTIKTVLKDFGADAFDYCNVKVGHRVITGALVNSSNTQQVIDLLQRDEIVKICLGRQTPGSSVYSVFASDLSVESAKADIEFINQNMDYKINFTYGTDAFIYTPERLAARDTLFSLPPLLIKNALIASNEFSLLEVEEIKRSTTPLHYLRNDYLCSAFVRYLSKVSHGLNDFDFQQLSVFIEDCDGLFLPREFTEPGCYGFKDGTSWLLSSCSGEFGAKLFASEDKNNILEMWAIIAYI